MRNLLGHHHVWVLVEDKEAIGRLEYLMIVHGQIVWAMWRFFRAKHWALPTKKVYAQAFGMLIDFIFARASDFQEITEREGLYIAFASALRYGTVRDGTDPLDLWWYPIGVKRSRKLLRCVCVISDWLVDKYDAKPINSFSRAATPAEQVVFWRRWNKKTASELLGHLRNRESVRAAAERAREYELPGPVSPVLNAPSAFPDDRIAELIFDGFRISDDVSIPIWKRLNIRDVMITLLLHFGGLRVSEPCHLWVDDIFVSASEPDIPIVIVHHPEDGVVNGESKKITRAAYLREHFNRVPLNMLPNKIRSGWKNCLLTRRDRNGFEVVWRSLKAAAVFLVLYRIYITKVRSPFLDHPFLLVTKNGQPMNPEAFRKSHGKAVRRIGLVVERALGTAPHGHRHTYGLDLKESGLSDKEIMICMHHASPESQVAYTIPSVGKVNQTLREYANSRDQAREYLGDLL